MHVIAKKDGQVVLTPKVKVGEPFDLVISIAAKPDVLVDVPASFEIDPFEVVTRTEVPLAPGSPAGAERNYVLRVVAWKTGKQTLPPIPISYLPPAPGASEKRVMTDALDVEVVPVIAGEQAKEELRPTVAPVDVMERDWRLVIAAAALAGAGLVAGAIALTVRWRRRRKKTAAPEPLADLRPAHEVALAKLRSLAASPLMSQPDLRLFYLELTGIVREFFGKRYGFEALELTTTELVDQLDKLIKRPTEDVARWLGACDMVKFARVPVGFNEATAALEGGVALVQKHKKIEEITNPGVTAASGVGSSKTDPPRGKHAMKVDARGALAVCMPYLLVVLIGGATALALSASLGADRSGLSFQFPKALALFAACLLVMWVGFGLYGRRSSTFSFSRVGDLARTRRGVVAWLAPLPRALRVVALGLLAFALARPQILERHEIEVEGIDIMLVLDLSKSMEERDLKRNRVDAAQRTIRKFLTERKNDKIGLVIFAKQAMLECPLTLDYAALDRIVADLSIGDLDPMGTAIGDGVGLAIASLRRSDAKSKVIILATDGDSNIINEMSPEDAIAEAKARGIRVFTVLMGREEDGRGGQVLDPFGRPEYATNPALLKKFASETNGHYYHAGDTDELEKGFEDVRASLEKSKHREVRRIPRELYPRFAAVGLGFLLLEILLSLTRWRKFP